MMPFVAGVITTMGSIAAAFAFNGRLGDFLPFLVAWVGWVAVCAPFGASAALLYRALARARGQ